MAIYETTGRSDQSVLGWTIRFIGLLVPFRGVLLTRRRSQSSNPANHRDSTALDTMISLSLWGLAFLLYTETRPKTPAVLSDSRWNLLSPKEGSAHNIIALGSETLLHVCRRMTNFMRKRIGGDDDLTMTQHQGSCCCGRAKFMLTAPKTLHSSATTSSTVAAAMKHQYPSTKLGPASQLVWKQNTTIHTFHNRNAHAGQAPVVSQHTFCTHCGTPIQHTIHQQQSNATTTPDVFVNTLCLDPVLQQRKPLVTTTTTNTKISAAGVSPSTTVSTAPLDGDDDYSTFGMQAKTYRMRTKLASPRHQDPASANTLDHRTVSPSTIASAASSSLDSLQVDTTAPTTAASLQLNSSRSRQSTGSSRLLFQQLDTENVEDDEPTTTPREEKLRKFLGKHVIQ